MKAKLKTALRALGRKVGIEVRLSGPNSRDDLRLINFLKQKEIDTVLDVGANDGGFAKMVLAAGFEGRIISFEALPDAYSALRTASERHSNWLVAPRLALSDEEGTASFHITQSDTSSSLLQPLDSFVSDTPQVEVKQIIKVATQKLDDLNEIEFDPTRTLLKLDVQGGETKVLRGAEKSLQTMAGILCEMSLMPLYEGQTDWVGLDNIISGLGFEVWDIWPGYRSPSTLRLTQVDGLYFRQKQK